MGAKTVNAFGGAIRSWHEHEMSHRNDMIIAGMV
jgi:hypothetical protein